MFPSVRLAAALAGAFIGAAPALADDIRIRLSADTKVESSQDIYRCGVDKISVEYINAGSVSLAVLTMSGEVIVAANVLAGSGARYAGGQYVWWTKGEAATLYDVRKGEADPGIACKPSM
jgi:membrane-bound inhibitor of C-type lysozyme